MSDRTELTCEERDAFIERMRPLLSVSSSLTNYVGGEVLNPMLPPHTATTWEVGRVDVLREYLDADGCRHYLLIEAETTP